MKRLHLLVFPGLKPLEITPSDLSRLQEPCPSLAPLCEKASAGQPELPRNGALYKFCWVDGFLYRECVASKRPGKVGTRTLVIPYEKRSRNSTNISSGLGWGLIFEIIASLATSASASLTRAELIKPVLLKPLPVVTEPFARVAVDIMGPLSPPSSEHQKYILTLIDFATGFPEAIPLKDIDSISVAETLLSSSRLNSWLRFTSCLV
ncbi:hypothetical protein Pcinc_014121 [Petrolisthes cinctipes]|uniref:Uncharacterized protein n=1 Tax=Petrolisthes cinctipes TaxID=88211 RepID=A0AAE1FXK7_PETCI|nr:hypothetical protein Pcinc_014121 [Petrolisthes cinctipes]